MKDLQILEQQQRESHRLLESIKLTKKHKIEQRSSLEKKLSSLKYSNGEKHALLVRAREVLSMSTRELGTARLHSDRSGGNLKRFSERLKRTISTVLLLQDKCRKVDITILNLKNSESIVIQKTKKVQECLQAAKNKYEDSQHQEKVMHESIHKNKVNAKIFSGEALEIISEISELEQDLTTAQQLEFSTKFKVESTATEIDAEVRRHNEVRLISEEKKFDLKEKKLELEDKNEKILTAVECKTHKLNETWKECATFQKEDFHDPVPLLKNDEQINAFEISKLRHTQEKNDAKLQELVNFDKSLQVQVDNMRKEYHDLQPKDDKLCKETDSILHFVESGKKIEDTRKSSNVRFFSKLEDEEIKAKSLKKSVHDLQNQHDMEISNAISESEHQSSLIKLEEKNLTEIQDKSQLLEATITNLRIELQEKIKMSKFNTECAKQHANTAKSALETKQKQTKEFETKENLKLKIDIDNIVCTQKNCLRISKLELEKILSSKSLFI